MAEKKSAKSANEKWILIDANHGQLSVRRQCQLIGLNRASLYYKPAAEKWPYRLKNRIILYPDEVWAIDITYIPMPRGFMYLVAIIDWHTRFVLAWELSNTMDTDFCLTALQQALAFGQPAIFNSDQGAQFTSHLFTNQLIDRGVQISMAGVGRCFDNIFIERLWRNVKYEEIYLYKHETVPDLYRGLSRYFKEYCYERPHQSLVMSTPAEA